MAPFLFLLALAIMDFITAIFYLRKQSPPWRVFLISLFTVTVLFFYLTGLMTGGAGVGSFIIVPIAFTILIIDLTAILFYIIRPILKA
jgi:hypothetical protein